ncbi:MULTISPECIES: hypothetical protein [unclassified Caballeronia]|uniref:hypothetical protein n=1 Tax=unclassified Caballeronia TaxID=2646786 RepID=UPI00286571C1|nr:MULTISPECIES: hypothetical protein [unclassified Caballeronia]MDR5741429.1 hypothetical protein [Caballeronia sp. LZ016]MDR5806742.1 hypothetical protein [Caballeronia sp. LZ019]
MFLLRPSEWSYSTGATGGVCADVVVASGGSIVLSDPDAKDEAFYYGGIGAGMGVGIKIPRLKLPGLNGKEVGGAGSAKSFPSGGAIFMTDAFRGSELSRRDIQGATVYVDAGGGLLLGAGGSVMFLGINSAELILGLSSPGMLYLAERAIAQAPALLVMGGITAGLQAGLGVGLLAGYLH